MIKNVQLETNNNVRQYHLLLIKILTFQTHSCVHFHCTRNGEEAVGRKVFKAEGGEPAPGSWEKMLSIGLWSQTVTAETQRTAGAERCAKWGCECELYILSES